MIKVESFKMTQSNQENKDEPLINLQNFSTIRLQIKFTNITSNMSLKETDLVEVLEVNNSGFVLALPEKTCNTNHHVTFSIKVTQADKTPPILFSATGKAKKVKTNEDGTLRVTVSLVQYKVEEWERFLAVYSKRQDEVTFFLKKVKGY